MRSDFWVVGNDRIGYEKVCSAACAGKMYPNAVDDVNGQGALCGAEYWYSPVWEESEHPETCPACGEEIDLRLVYREEERI